MEFASAESCLLVAGFGILGTVMWVLAKAAHRQEKKEAKAETKP